MIAEDFRKPWYRLVNTWFMHVLISTVIVNTTLNVPKLCQMFTVFKVRRLRKRTYNSVLLSMVIMRLVKDSFTDYRPQSFLMFDFFSISLFFALV